MTYIFHSVQFSGHLLPMGGVSGLLNGFLALAEYHEYFQRYSVVKKRMFKTLTVRFLPQLIKRENTRCFFSYHFIIKICESLQTFAN